MFIKCNFILIFLCLLLNTAKAEKIAQGYIITQKNDTISGSFNLQRARVKELSYYKPFNWGMFSLSVNFLSKDGQEKEYLPNALKGFDFEFEDTKYRFRSLKIDSDELQTFSSEDAPSYVFAQVQIEDTPISYYVFRFNNDVFRKYKGRGDFFNYYKAYYAKTPTGLVKIHRTYQKNELASIMKDDLHLEDSFVGTIPKKYMLDEIEEVINNYNSLNRGKPQPKNSH